MVNSFWMANLGVIMSLQQSTKGIAVPRCRTEWTRFLKGTEIFLSLSTAWIGSRVRIRRYRIAKCDTISTNCYAFAQNASQKVRRIVFCENEWVITPLTSVKNSCWSMFSKPKSSNFEAKKLFNFNIDRWLLHQNIAGKTPTITLSSQLGPKPTRPKPSRPKTNSAQNQVGPKPTRPKTNSAQN